MATQSAENSTAAARLADELEEAIAQGILHLGEALPKIRNLAAERRLSHTTVVAALKTLEERELIHRLGRAYYVGPSPTRQKSRTGLMPPTILLLSRRPEEWSEFHGNFLQPLAFRFASEADRFGVRLHPVLAYAPPHGEALFTAGKTAVADLVRSLGGAYLGTVVLTMRRFLPDHVEWLRLLESMGKPVIWLQDDEPERPFPRTARLVRLSYAEWMNEKSMQDKGTGEAVLRPTALALKTLVAAGHRHIGYAASGTGMGELHRGDGLGGGDGENAGGHAASPTGGEAWVIARGKRLLHDAREAQAALRSGASGQGSVQAPAPVHVHVQYDFAAKPTFEGLQAAWPRLLAHPAKAVRQCIAEASEGGKGRFTSQVFDGLALADREFLCEALALGPLLSGMAGGAPPVTALVAPNDPMACRQFAALRRMGYALPGDISLISFDNRPTLRPFPISSIDFGLDDLGYRAFHLLFGAVSIATGGRLRQGNLRGTCRVVDQGSVGLAGAARGLR